MKKIIITLVAIFAIALPSQIQAQADAISNYFEQYMDDESFTSVYISSKMFEMLARVSTDDEDWEEMRSIIKDLKGIRILVKEEGGAKYYKEAVKKINFDEYDELMTVRAEDSNVKFVIKDEGNIIKELLLVVGSDDEFVLMSFVGKIDLEKIAKLSENLDIDIDGLDHLEHLNDKDKKKDKKKKKNKED
ncbi:MAG: DUF4252 domain-containing protein [Saprospiraceae bacterium]